MLVSNDGAHDVVLRLFHRLSLLLVTHRPIDRCLATSRISAVSESACVTLADKSTWEVGVMQIGCDVESLLSRANIAMNRTEQADAARRAQQPQPSQGSQQGGC